MTEWHYVPGDWYVRDDITGVKTRASQVQKDWRGLYVGPANFAPRHPHDFVRNIKDGAAPGFTRNPDPVFLTSDTRVTATQL